MIHQEELFPLTVPLGLLGALVAAVFSDICKIVFKLKHPPLLLTLKARESFWKDAT